MKKSAIYIHIPFCDHKCIYCDFYSIITEENISPYLQSLKKEINYYSDFYSADRIFNSIYFGGGTPSLMHPDYISDIITALKRIILSQMMLKLLLKLIQELLTKRN